MELLQVLNLSPEPGQSPIPSLTPTKNHLRWAMSCNSAKSNLPERYAREINFKMKHPRSNQASNCFSKDGNCPKNILDVSRDMLALTSFQIALYKCFKIYTEHNSLYWCRKLWLLIFLSEGVEKLHLCEEAKAALYTSPPLEYIHYKAITERTSALPQQCSTPLVKVFSFTVHSLLSLLALADHCSENTFGHFYNIRTVVFSRE